MPAQESSTTPGPVTTEVIPDDLDELINKLDRLSTTTMIDSEVLNQVRRELLRRRQEIIQGTVRIEIGRYRRSVDIFIFDFDDTLFPTSWLASWIPDLVTTKRPFDPNIPRAQDLEKDLEDIDRTLCTLFEAAFRKASVYVVTASQVGWMQQMVENFLPQFAQKIFPYIKDRIYAVPVDISRDGFKTRVMGNIITQVSHRNGLVRVFSVGDTKSDGTSSCQAIQETRAAGIPVRGCIFYMVRAGREEQFPRYLIEQLGVLLRLIESDQYRDLFEHQFSGDACQSIHFAGSIENEKLGHPPALGSTMAI